MICLSERTSLYKEAAKKFIEQNQYPKSFSSKVISHILAKRKEDKSKNENELFREIYKKAGLNRQVFYKIKNNVNYAPKKSTAIAICLALELDMDDTRELLGLAGYYLSYCDKRDLIIRFCIRKKIYNLYHVNELLYEFRQKTITINIQ